MLDRLGHPPPRCVGGTANINVTLPEYRIHTRAVLDSLGALADALRPSPGLKTIVLVAEGMFADRDNDDDIARLAARTESAGTRVYALHLESPILDIAAPGNVTSTHYLDDSYGFAAMAEVAGATGGTALRVSGSAIPQLDQIDEESSGYYVLGVEVDPAERTGKAMALSVTGRRPGLDVRARRMLSIQPPSRSPAALTADEASVAAAKLLQSPINMSELPMSVDTASSPMSVRGMARQLLLTEVSAPPDKIAAMGFHLATLDGRTVAYKIESPVSLTAVDVGASYLVALDLAPGAYRLRVSGIAANGARGSVERLFVVKPAGEQTGLSDIFFGADNVVPWQPVTGPAPAQKRLGVRVEMSPADPGSSAVIKLMVGAMGRAEWIATQNLMISGDGNAKSAAGAINIGQLARGRYVARVEFWRDNALIASTGKMFDIR